MDRLGDGFWNDDEITQFNKEDVVPDRPKWNVEPTQRMMATYPLYRNGKFTGKVIIVAVDDQVDGLSALTTEWVNTGLDVRLGECGEMTYGWDKKIEALQIVLERYKYVPKFTDVLACDQVYNYEQFMENLL